jgi:hypothetical protein
MASDSAENKRTLSEVELSPEDYQEEKRQLLAIDQTTITESAKTAIQEVLTDPIVIRDISSKVKDQDTNSQTDSNELETVKSAVIKALGEPETINKIAKAITNAVVDKINILLDNYEERIRALEGKSMKLESEVKECRRDRKQLEQRYDDIEQYSRRNSLRIHNPKWIEDADEDTDKIVLAFFKDELGLKIEARDIDRSHRVGRPTFGNRARAILVKFATHNAKTLVYKCKSSLTDSNVYINEDLTQTRFQLLRKALSLKKERHVKKVWTTDGRILVRTLDERVHRITSYSDLCDMVDEDLDADTDSDGDAEADNTVIQMSGHPDEHPPAITFMGHGRMPPRAYRRGRHAAGSRNRRGKRRPSYQPPRPAWRGGSWLTSTPVSVGGTQIPNFSLGPDASKMQLPGHPEGSVTGSLVGQ